MTATASKLRNSGHVTLSANDKTAAAIFTFFLRRYEKRGGDEKRGTTG
jgi:hypothetical protein